MSTSRNGTLPNIYLLIENRSKSNNLGSIIRCASAFGVTKLVTIGFSKCAVKGSHGASKHLEIIAFPVVEKAIQYIRQDLLCRSIVGLIGSIPDGYEHAECALNGDDTKFFVACDANRGSTGRRSIPLDKISFVEGNICFAIDKERHGLPLSLSQLCDVLIHVPHLPISGQLPLFNTPICLSILLDSFARSSGFLERNFQGQKFSVARPRTEYIDGSDVVNASSFPITKGCPTEAEDVFDGLRAAFPGNRETCDY